MLGSGAAVAELLQLHAETMGTGRIGLLLLHPNPADSTYWMFQTAHLSRFFTTIAVDLPGYGHSPRLEGPITMEELAASAWGVVDRLSIDQAVVAGVSIGAALCMRIARQQPERCRALILSGYGYRAQKTFASRRLAGYREGGLRYRARHLRDGYSDAFRQSEIGRLLLRLADDRVGMCDVPSIMRLFESHGQPDPPSLFALEQPTLIVAGTADYAYESVAGLHERIPGSELMTLPGAGHACNQERPWEWNTCVLDFLRDRVRLPIGG